MSAQLTSSKPLTGRFAPSPTGEIHAGTIFAALQAWLIAKSHGGEMVLRIEDLDPERSKQTYADAIMCNYEALGLTWDRGPFYQHDRIEAYQNALDQLKRNDLLYPCFCTRADLRSARAPHLGERTVYDRRCLVLSEEERAARTKALAVEGRASSLRIQVPDTPISFVDIYQGFCTSVLSQDCGDFIVRRADGGFAYQLAVVVDDAEQGINCVARGYDLLSSVAQQMFLQTQLGYESPHYAHFPLFCAPDGRRLAKRNHDAGYNALVERFGSPKAVLGHIAYIGGLQAEDAPTTPEKLLDTFDIASLAELYRDRVSFTFDCA